MKKERIKIIVENDEENKENISLKRKGNTMYACDDNVNSRSVGSVCKNVAETGSGEI